MPTQAPPDIPSGLDPKVADYLRRVNTWAFQEIDGKVSKTEPAPALMLSPSDQKQPNTVFRISVDSSGNLSTTQVPLGGGKP